MKSREIIFLMVFFVGFLFGLTDEAKAGGGGGGPSCLVATPSGTTMKGIWGVEVMNYDGIVGDVDATLRLQWQGKEKFFRARLLRVLIVTPEDLICQILAANPLDTNGNTILNAFMISPSSSIKITNNSITGLDFDFIPFGGGNYSGLADITFYVQN